MSSLRGLVPTAGRVRAVGILVEASRSSGRLALDRFRRCCWRSFALAFGALSVIAMLVRLARLIDGRLALAPGAASLVVGGLISYWITIGAWRRSVSSETRERC